ncbi:HdeD family acid-resistance protein [Monashia sp. NPDC004114]
MIVTSPVTELRTWTRGQIEAVSKGWWVLLTTGVVGIVAGAIVVFTQWTVDSLVVFVGTVLIVRGIFTMFSIPVDGSLRTWSIVLGIVEAFVGVGVFIWPGPALLVVAFSIGWLLLFRGTMAIVGSVGSRSVLPYWGLILVAGILEVVVALYLLTRPDITLLAAVFAIGFSAMLYGVLEIAVSLVVKSLPQRFDELTGTVDESDSRKQLAPVS